MHETWQLERTNNQDPGVRPNEVKQTSKIKPKATGVQLRSCKTASKKLGQSLSTGKADLGHWTPTTRQNEPEQTRSPDTRHKASRSNQEAQDTEVRLHETEQANGC